MYQDNNQNGNKNYPTYGNNNSNLNQNINSMNNNSNIPNNSNVNNNDNYYGTNSSKTKEEIDAEKGKTMALIAYLGPFVLLPYFKEKENPFVLYHVKQGLNLFIIEVIIEIIMGVIKFLLSSVIFWIVSTLDFFVGLGIIGLSAIGMYYVLEGKMQEIPFISDFKIIK